MKNRLENELKRYERSQDRLRALFSPAAFASTDYQKQQMAFFRKLRQQHPNANPLLLALLKAEEQALERKLVPKAMFRWLRRVLLAGKAERAESADTRRIAFSYALSPQHHLRLELSFQKQGHRQRMIKYQVGLFSGKEPLRSHQLDGKEGLLAPQALYNLLSGRPVALKDRWIQLDLTDANARGEHRVITSKFDLEKSLSSLPLQEKKDPRQYEKLLRELQKGNQPLIMLGQPPQPTFLEVNPAFKTIQFRPQTPASSHKPAVSPRRQQFQRKKGHKPSKGL